MAYPFDGEYASYRTITPGEGRTRERMEICDKGVANTVTVYFPDTSEEGHIGFTSYRSASEITYLITFNRPIGNGDNGTYFGRLFHYPNPDDPRLDRAIIYGRYMEPDAHAAEIRSADDDWTAIRPPAIPPEEKEE